MFDKLPNIENTYDQPSEFQTIFKSKYNIEEADFGTFCSTLDNSLVSEILSLIISQNTPNKSTNMMKIFHFSHLWQQKSILDEFKKSEHNNWLEDKEISKDVTICLFDISYQLSIMKRIFGEQSERYLEHQRNAIMHISTLFSNLRELEQVGREAMIMALNTQSSNIKNELFHPDHLKSQTEFLQYLQCISLDVEHIRWLDNPEAVKFVYTHFQNSFADFDRKEKSNIEILDEIKRLINKEQIILVLKYPFNYIDALAFPVLSYADNKIRSKAINYVEKIASEFDNTICNILITSLLCINDINKIDSEYEDIKVRNARFLKKKSIITDTEESYKIESLDQIEDVLIYIRNSTDPYKIRELSTSALKYIHNMTRSELITVEKALDINEKILDIALYSISKLENTSHHDHSNYISL